MRYRTTDKLRRKLLKIGRKDRGFFDSVEKQLILFENNDKHPSLRNHKLLGKLDGYWSISVGMGFRMIYYVNGGEAYFVDIGTHDEVYKAN